MKNILICLFLIFITACSSRVKKISLSFDDAPKGQGWKYTGVQRTEAIIDKLALLDIKRAAFYVQTNRLKTNEDIYRIQKYFLAGHMIGNHTHSHLNASKVEMKEFFNDVVRAHNILKERNLNAQYFRFPYLNRGTNPHLVTKSLDTLGLKDGYITVDTYDWLLDEIVIRSQAEFINLPALKSIYLEMIIGSLEFYDKVAQDYADDYVHVLLLHENDLAGEFIGDLVLELKNRGWKFVSPEEAYFNAPWEEMPNASNYGQGRVISYAQSKGYKGPIRSKYENKKEVTALIKKSGVFKKTIGN